MSKKLVKTAKQQFEERLKELTLMTSYQGVKDEKFYLCENGHKEMSILRDSKEHGFIEYKYQGGYQSMIDSEEFLYKMVCRFNEIGEPVKHIFNWYASADKDLTPFAVYDIWQCMEYLTQSAFEDLYEEVPDVRIITAKEQWEKDKKGLRAVRFNDGKVLLVDITESEVKFYDNYDGYASYTYPSMDEMRKDAFFVSRVVDELMRSANHNKIGDFMEWVREGGSFPLNLAVIYDSEYQGFTFMKYEDKEEPAEKPTVKNEFKEERDALREKMVQHIIELCEQGLTLNVEVLCQNYFLLWCDGGYSLTESIKDCWLAKDDKEEWRFYWTAKDGDYNDRLSFFKIETLHNIIEALQ